MHKVGFITDLHIGEDGKAFEVNTLQNFDLLLSEIQKWKLDHLIIGGDLCFRNPVRKVYTIIHEKLEATKIPYSVIVGNHDDCEMLVDGFHLSAYYHPETNELYFIKKIGSRVFIFLDTKKGTISEVQLSWLEKELELLKESKPVIIMHYPPVLGGVPHMDSNYFLENKDEVVRVLAKYPGNLLVFTGHYHVEKSINFSNLQVFITPSCFVQIDQQEAEFKPDHHRPAYRIIDFFDDGTLHTSVHYLHHLNFDNGS